MRLTAKKLIAKLLRLAGLQIRRLRPGRDAFTDIARLARERSIVIDVGANEGQTVERLRHFLANPMIHCFEPGPGPFETLRSRYSGDAHVHLNAFAIGAGSEKRELVENADSKLSSFLKPGAELWGDPAGKTLVDVTSLDEYCADRGIGRIDLLKSDTQGFELEVFKGADRMLSAGNVHLVFLEVTFAALYEGLPSYETLKSFLEERGFDLYALYDFHIFDDRAGWTDALFINRAYESDR